MTKIGLWYAVDCKGKKVAEIRVTEDNDIEILSGRGKIKVNEIPCGVVGSEPEEPEPQFDVWITNTSMPIQG